MIPVVLLQQMCRIGIFKEYFRTIIRIGYASLIACVSAEARGFVMVASVAHVIEAQSILPYEYPLSLINAFQRTLALSMRIRCHPEAVKVRKTVPRLADAIFHNYPRIILNNGITLHTLRVPQRHTLWRNNIYGAVR